MPREMPEITGVIQMSHFESIASVSKQINKIVSYCLRKEPFFGTIGMGLKVHVTDHHLGRDVRTAATDGRFLVVNPVYFEDLGLRKQMTLMVHEWCHVAFGHSVRRGGRDARVWNEATDHVINNILLEKGYEPIEGWLCDEKYKGWHEERVYNDLIKDAKIVNKPSSRQQDPSDAMDDDPSDDTDSSGKDNSEAGDEADKDDKDDNASDSSESGDGSGEESSDKADGDSDESGASNDASPNDGDSSQSDSSDGGKGSDGGDGVDGGDGGDGAGSSQPESDSPGDSQDNSGGMGRGSNATGEVWDTMSDDGSALSDQEMRDEARKAIERAANAQDIIRRSSGTGQGVNESRIVDRIISRKKDWGSQLRQFVRQSGVPAGRSWSRLDRRALVRGQYQPHVVHSGLDRVVVGVDVSGSIDWDECRAFVSEIEKIRKTVPINEIHVVPYNYIVLQDQIKTVRKGEKIPTRFDVGGGTRFAPVFNWVARQSWTPDCVMMFTDLGSNEYGEKPKYPVLWASSVPVYRHEYSHGSVSTNAPPFGKVIEIEV